MSNYKQLIIALTIIFAILIGFTVFFEYSSRIPENPAGTLGNTSGNLYNKGLFCEQEDFVYFANPYDNNSLYSMNSDETEIKRLTASGVNSLNVAGNHIYYFQSSSQGSTGLGYIRPVTGIYRTTKKGTKSTCLERNAFGEFIVADNNLFYYYHNKKKSYSLHSMDLQGESDTELSNLTISPLCIYEGYIYHTGAENDHSLYRLDIATGIDTLVFEGKIWFPQLSDNYIYYLDAEQNYALCRFSLSDTESASVLTNDRVDIFNVYGGYIYYQKNDPDSPALIRMSIDGSNPEIVSEGIYSDINITSRYVYFHNFGQDIPLYRTPTFGDINVSVFEGASQAAAQYLKE